MKPVIVFVLVVVTLFAKSQDGEKLFRQKCSACHTIGSGRLVGPDLLNISQLKSREWLLEFISSSQTMIKSGDEQANEIYEEFNRILMPDPDLNSAEIASILDYIDKAGAGGVVQETKVPDLLEGTTRSNIEKGKLLFSGAVSLSNGGLACMSCHSVRDNTIIAAGTLAKELTETYDNMGSAGIVAILKSPPFPAMKDAYSAHPLSENEMTDLTAYLRYVSQNRYYQTSRVYTFLFVLSGIFLSMLIITFTLILYYRRKQGSVNDDIFRRQSPVMN